MFHDFKLRNTVTLKLLFKEESIDLSTDSRINKGSKWI